MADQPSGDLADIKRALRREAMARRTGAAAVAANAGLRLRDHLLAVFAGLERGTVVSAYWPMGDEIDPVPAMEAFHERGHPIGLPVMEQKDRPLVFRRWYPDMVLDDGGFGTRIPGLDAPTVTPRVLMVPMLAFDRAGYRIGYGGGFYDRTLQGLRELDRGVLAVGIAYAGQEVATIPRDGNDQRLDMMVTESGPIALGDGETPPDGLATGGLA